MVDGAPDVFSKPEEACVTLDWRPQAKVLMGWTRLEAIGKGVEELVFPQPQRAVHRQWVDHFLSEASADATGGRYETSLLHKDGHEVFSEVSLTALRPRDRLIINAFVRD